MSAAEDFIAATETFAANDLWKPDSCAIIGPFQRRTLPADRRARSAGPLTEAEPSGEMFGFLEEGRCRECRER
ncbi:hypothetical protein JL39_29770 [Rhizobium sp. YS-1r]|nr:hypothetical protein JL39_29770 [Rhizobium sp. YS-1r]